MVTAIVSVMTGIPVRSDVAMTGEITLRGRVLPIGGLKEKLLAASRGGIKTVLIPEENAKDLVEINESIKKGLDIVPVSRMDEVLARAFMRKPEPIEWDEEKAKPTETSVSTEPPVEEDSSIADGALKASPHNQWKRRRMGAAVFVCGDRVVARGRLSHAGEPGVEAGTAMMMRDAHEVGQEERNDALESLGHRHVGRHRVDDERR